jgi:hypothetical protein
MEEVPVFRPTMSEFSDFAKFVASIKERCTKSGICKVIPPPEWKATKKPYESSYSIVIPAPIQQVVTGKQGIFQQMNVESKQMTVEKFKEQAERVSEEQGINKLDPEMRERKFWKTITFSPPLYGADMLGSLFDEDLQIWNLQKLDSILNLLGTKIPGITEPYLYFGMWKAMFSWHTEDMDLYSINYLHYGEPKTWYAIPSSEKAHFERIAQQYFPEEYKECRQFLRHKMSMISPMLLVRQFNLPVSHCIQNAGEFVITQPGAYHAGFNHGFNCAESVNFAIEDWIAFGRVAKHCTCQNDTVRIDMDVFLQKYYQSKGLVYEIPIRKEPDASKQNATGDATVLLADGSPSAPPKKKRGRPAKPKLFPLDPKPVNPGPPRKRGRPRKYPLPQTQNDSAPQPKRIRLNITLSQSVSNPTSNPDAAAEHPAVLSSSPSSAPNVLGVQQLQRHTQHQHQQQYSFHNNDVDDEISCAIQKNVIPLPHENFDFMSRPTMRTSGLSLESLSQMSATPEGEMIENDELLEFSSSTGSSSFENETEHDFDNDNDNELNRGTTFKQNDPPPPLFELHDQVVSTAELQNCTSATTAECGRSDHIVSARDDDNTTHAHSSQHTSQLEEQQHHLTSPLTSHPGVIYDANDTHTSDIIGDHFSEQTLSLISTHNPLHIGHLSDFIDHFDHSTSFSAFVSVNDRII